LQREVVCHVSKKKSVVQIHSYGPGLIFDIANIGSLRQREGEHSCTPANVHRYANHLTHSHTNCYTNSHAYSYTDGHAYSRANRASEDWRHKLLERRRGYIRPLLG
jgi:hypothetical protein